MSRNTLAGALAACALLASSAAHAQSSIVGGWSYSDGTDLVAITFYSSGDYVFTQVGPADAFGHSGVERASYAWDPLTHLFTEGAPSVNTDGEWGFSNPHPPESIAVSGNQFIFSDSSGDPSVTFDRVVGTSAIVNGWTTAGYPGAGDLLSLWFLADGNYLLASAGPGTFQYGTYSWDAASGAINAAMGGDSTFTSFALLSGAVSGNTLLLHTSAGDFALAAANPVPEPEIYSLMGAGLLAFFLRRRKPSTPRPSESIA